MCKLSKRFVLTGVFVLGLHAAAWAQTYGFGRLATHADIAAWHIDVRPDGHGVKPGRGSADQGQPLYDEKCASCHGTFGESNSYIVLAGGVEPDDIQTGRASRLRDPDVVRTVGNKLNYATTLWDYINRAMPWHAPQSLTVDEVYALTAYVLYLNDIVSADFELNEKTLLTVKMPNRNGMTTDHGMASVKGKPDAQGIMCMNDCRGKPKVISELPPYARNAHGNLLAQNRTFGAYGAIDTAGEGGATLVKGAPVGKTASVADQAVKIDGRALLAQYGCTLCHAIETKMVGPSMLAIAKKYQQQDNALQTLAHSIREGGVGRWGQIPMPAQPALSEQDLNALARWIAAGAQ